MLSSFESSLSYLKNLSVEISAANGVPGYERCEVELSFSDGSKLEAAYWRVFRDGRASVSSFDHLQQYGLPSPMDSIEALQEILKDKILATVELERESGDLWFLFSERIKFQVFNFTGYEVWHFTFPDGTGQFSNYAK
jgi:hypothetical protein